MCDRDQSEIQRQNEIAKLVQAANEKYLKFASVPRSERNSLTRQIRLYNKWKQTNDELPPIL